MKGPRALYRNGDSLWHCKTFIFFEHLALALLDESILYDPSIIASIMHSRFSKSSKLSSSSKWSIPTRNERSWWKLSIRLSSTCGERFEMMPIYILSWIMFLVVNYLAWWENTRYAQFPLFRSILATNSKMFLNRLCHYLSHGFTLLKPYSRLPICIAWISSTETSSQKIYSWIIKVTSR